MKQGGAAQLFITIVLLIVVMMLGITATIISSTQLKLAGNLQFENIAFNQAEAAAAVAHGWLNTGNNAKNASFTTNSTCAGPLYPATCNPDPYSNSWWSDSKSLAVGNDDGKRYFIQKVASEVLLATGPTMLNCGGPAYQPPKKFDLYRITARGTSAKGTSKIIQTNISIQKANADPDPCVSS